MTRNCAKNQTVSEYEVQTDPIVVPFPLPPIGRIIVTKAVETESISMQTEYTWVLSEFPSRVSASPVAEVDRSESSGVRESDSFVDMKQKEKKKRTSPKKADAKEISIKPTEAEPVAVAPVEPEPVAIEPTETEPVATEFEQPEVAKEVETTVPSADHVMAEDETQQVASVDASTPKKRGRKKKEADEAIPATPATTAAPETPVADVLSTPPVKRASSLLPPILSDSSDDDTVLLNKGSPLKRTITPVTAKPTVTAPVKATKPMPQPKAVESSSSSSSSDSSSESDKSSSSDSDNDVPSAALMLSGPKRKKSAPTVSPNVAKFGPLVQVKADESAVDEIRKTILEKIPEPLRKGAVKEAVVDSINERVIFHLRATPKVTHFLTTGLITVPLEVLSEKDRKVAMELFKDSSAPVEQASKRKRKE